MYGSFTNSFYFDKLKSHQTNKGKEGNMKIIEVEKALATLLNLGVEPTILVKTLNTQSSEGIRAEIGRMKKNISARAVELWHKLKAECEKNGKVGTDPEGYITFQPNLELSDVEESLLCELNQEINDMRTAIIA